MRKILITTTFLFSLLTLSWGQVSFEVLTGANVAWQAHSLVGNTDESILEDLNKVSEPITKPFVGLLLRHKTNDFLDLKFELQYSEKGKKEQLGAFRETLSYLKYIQAVDFRVIGDLKVGGGMFWALRIATELEGSSFQSTFNREDLDTGFLAVLSYDYKRLSFRVAYYHSFTRLYRENLFSSLGLFLGSTERKNRAVQVGLGYVFSRKKKSEKIEI